MAERLEPKGDQQVSTLRSNPGGDTYEDASLLLCFRLLRIRGRVGSRLDMLDWAWPPGGGVDASLVS